MRKQLFYKFAYILSLISLLGFIGAFIYYYISDGMYMSIIPILAFIVIDLICNTFPQNKIIAYVRFVSMAIIILFMLSIIIKTLVIHPIILVGSILSMVLFVMVLYYSDYNE